MTEEKEGARLVREWSDLKDSVNELERQRIELEEEHENKKRVYDTILGDIRDRLTREIKTLETAKKKAKEVEDQRKDIYSQLKATAKDSSNYAQVKERYDDALAAKKQAVEKREKVQQDYEQALKPFEERLNSSLEAKEKAQLRLKKVKDKLAEEVSRFKDLSRRCFEHTDAQKLFDQEMTDLVETSIDVRKKINLLAPVRDRAAEILRAFVLKNPTGWSTGAIDAAQRYLMWVNLAQTHGVVLEDNPGYWYELDDVLGLIGMAGILKFVRIDKTKLENTAKAGQLRGRGDNPISIEELFQIRQKELGTPRMKAFALGELGIDELMISLAQDLYERDDTTLEALANSDKLPRGAVTALRNAGITKVFQLQRLSLQQLAMVFGIGEKRAVQIFRVLSR